MPGAQGGTLTDMAAQARPAGGEQHRRVLVADNEPDHRWLVRLALEDSVDFDVVGEASDGAQAAQQALDMQPDVVLLDVDMPGRDGLASLAAVQAAAPRAKVVLMTAYADEPGLAARAASRGVPLLDKGDFVVDLTDRLNAALAPCQQRRPSQGS